MTDLDLLETAAAPVGGTPARQEGEAVAAARFLEHEISDAALMRHPMLTQGLVESQPPPGGNRHEVCYTFHYAVSCGGSATDAELSKLKDL